MRLLAGLATVALAACADSGAHEDPEEALPDDPFIVAERATERLEELTPELATLGDIVQRDRGAVTAYQAGVDALGTQVFVVDSTEVRTRMCEQTTEWAGEQVEDMLSWVIALNDRTMSMERFKLRFARADSAIVETMDCWRALWNDPEFDAHRRLWRAQTDSIMNEAQRARDARIAARRRQRECVANVRMPYTVPLWNTDEDDDFKVFLPDGIEVAWVQSDGVSRFEATPGWLNPDELHRETDGLSMRSARARAVEVVYAQHVRWCRR